MPLIQSKSKKAFEKNVEAEMDAGKPKKQSLAIAYNIKKKSPKKMASGGIVPHQEQDSAPEMPMPKAPQEIDADDHYDSIADAILSKKRSAKAYAEGGMVDLEENSEEGSNEADSDNFEAYMKEQYDDSQLESQPEDSNEHGDEIDSDDHDMVSSIRKKMKSKRS